MGSSKPGVTPSSVPGSTVVSGAPASATPSVTSAGTPSVIEAPPPSAIPNPTGQQTLTLAGPVDGPSTLDPATVRDAESAFLVRQIFRGLVRLDDQLNPVPDLASRIEISPDGLTFTFTLHDGISFDSGRRITAEDVRFSLERATDPALEQGNGSQLPAQVYLGDIVGASDRMAGKAGGLSGVEVVDPKTIKIRLVRPTRDFLLKLAGTPAYIVDPQNVATGNEWWRKPNGSGPFAVTDWRGNDQIVLTGHQGYQPNPPTLKTVVILLGTKAFDPMTLYQRGEVDVADVPSSSLDRVQANNSPYRSQLVVQPMYAAAYVMLNPNVAPLDNPDYRRALVASFDRAKVATVSLEGFVKPADGIVPPGLAGRSWPAQVPPYDLATGKSLLAKADGGQAPPELTIVTNGSVVPISMKQVYERDLELPVQVLQMDWQDYLQDLVARKLPAFVLDWLADYPDPESFLRTLFYSRSPDNYIGYKNAEVDRLLDQAIIEPDSAKRASLYEQAQQRLIDDGVLIPLYYDVAYTLVKPNVYGLSVTPLGILGLESVWVTK